LYILLDWVIIVPALDTDNRRFALFRR